MKVFRALQGRRYAFSWHVFRALLAHHDLPRAQGWEPLIEKYESFKADDKHTQTALAVAQKAYDTAVRYGTRAVTTYKITPENARTLARLSAQLVDQTSPFSNNFPFPLREEELAKASFNAQFVKRGTSPEGVVRMIACSKRAFRHRSELKISDLDQAAIDALRHYGFDELIGVTRGFVQAYDAIVIDPAEGKVEIHVDFCTPTPLPDSDITLITKYYSDRLNKLLPQPENQPKILHRPVNLFDRIQRFYDDADGNIISLSHATGTNSVKAERMRAKRDDLRKEPFHEKGLKAIASTDIFAIVKGWDGEVLSIRPTIDLPGKVSLAGADDARLDYAIIENCSGKKDFEFAVSMLK